MVWLDLTILPITERRRCDLLQKFSSSEINRYKNYLSASILFELQIGSKICKFLSFLVT